MNSQDIITIIETYNLESLIRVVTLYYLFKLLNIVAIAMNNAIDAIANIWESIKGDT